MARAAVRVAQLLLAPAGLERSLRDHELGRNAGLAAGLDRVRPHLGDEVPGRLRHRAGRVARAAHGLVEPGLERGLLEDRCRRETARAHAGPHARHARRIRQTGKRGNGRSFHFARADGRNCRPPDDVGEIEAGVAGSADAGVAGSARALARLTVYGRRRRILAPELAEDDLGQAGAPRLRHVQRHLLVEQALVHLGLLAVHHAGGRRGVAHGLHDHLQEQRLELLGRRAQGDVLLAVAARQALEVAERVGVEGVELEAGIHHYVLR